MNLLRRILTLLIVTAYLGATTLQVAPTYAANADMSGSTMASMMPEPDGQTDKMPCKGVLPNCMTDIGCIFLVSLTTSNLTPFATTTWSPVIYGNASQALPGRTIKPALGPPISLA